MKHKPLLAAALIASAYLLSGSKSTAQKTIPVRVDRWLAVQQLTGTVSYGRGTTFRAARVGDRLEVAGDSLTTGKDSTASLILDTGIGTISVSQNTILRVQSLTVAPDNGRITRLKVSQGQVYYETRPSEVISALH